MYNCLISDKNIFVFKNSKFFKKTLGTSFTMVNMTTGEKTSNLNNFEDFFYKKFNTFPYKQGELANINIYSNPLIDDRYILFYNEKNDELSLSFCPEKFNNVDSFLGMCVMEIDKHFGNVNAKNNTSTSNNITQKQIDDILHKFKTQPNNVTWDELQLYKKIKGLR